ncbi:MAG: hypothetical protein C3F11_17560 [Methylocystaceae bacterium]|nr:MAG: hypothetical protein C3F11_17560 [Methylocystaceae bacterium]
MAFGGRAELWALTGVEAAALGAGGDLALTAFPGVVFATGLDSLEAGVEGVAVTFRACGGVACAAAAADATGTARAGATTGFSCVLAIAPSCAVVFLRLVSPVAPVWATIDVCLRIASAFAGLTADFETLVFRRRDAAGFAAVRERAVLLRAGFVEPAFAVLLSSALVRAALVRALAAADFATPLPGLAVALPARISTAPILAALLLEAVLAALFCVLLFAPDEDFLVALAEDSPRAALEAVRFAADRVAPAPPVAPLLPLDADALRPLAVFLLEGIRGVLLSLSRFGDGTEAS